MSSISSYKLQLSVGSDVMINRGSTSVLRIFQILSIVSTLLFFAGSLLSVTFASAQPEAKATKNHLRKTQLILYSSAASICIAECIVEGLRVVSRLGGDPMTGEPDLVYALYRTLTWAVQLLCLVKDESAAILPYCGASFILLIFQGATLVIAASAAENKVDVLWQAALALQCAQILILCLLLGTYLAQYFAHQRTQATEEEREPLLESESGTTAKSKISEEKEPDQDEKDRRKIHSRPLREYVMSFGAFRPLLLPLSHRQTIYVVLMGISTLVSRIVMVVRPFSLGMVINNLGNGIPWGSLCLYVGLKLLSSDVGLGGLESTCSWALREDLEVKLHVATYNHLMNLSADFHDSKKSSLVWLAMYQGNALINLIQESSLGILPVLTDFATAAAALAILYGPYMSFITASTVVIFYWLTFTVIGRSTELRRSYQDAYRAAHYQLTESSSNWTTVSQFGRIPHESERYSTKKHATRSAIGAIFIFGQINSALREVILSTSFFIACVIAAIYIRDHKRTIGDFMVLVSYWGQMTSPLGTFASQINRVSRNLVDAERLLVLLEKERKITEAPDAQPFTFAGGAVDFEDVCFSYDGKRTVADKISFTVQPGETVALVGETGGGKSTLLKLLFRFYDVESGRILIDGQDIKNLQLESFRRHLAIVPQSPAVFNMTVLENVRYPDLDCTEEEVIEACKAASLHDKIMTFPKGYQELVGERGTKLSGGELQRLAIARAMLKKANILLLDEATSSVDSITEAHIQKSLGELCAGKTTFVIAHRLSTILQADQILVIRNGQMVESGKHKELLKKGGAYAELWNSQLKLQDTTDGSGSRSTSPSNPKVDLLTDDLSTSNEPPKELSKQQTADQESAKPEDPQSKGTGSGARSLTEGHGHKAHQESHSKERGRTSVRPPA